LPTVGEETAPEEKEGSEGAILENKAVCILEMPKMKKGDPTGEGQEGKKKLDTRG